MDLKGLRDEGGSCMMSLTQHWQHVAVDVYNLKTHMQPKNSHTHFLTAAQTQCHAGLCLMTLHLGLRKTEMEMDSLQTQRKHAAVFHAPDFQSGQQPLIPA